MADMSSLTCCDVAPLFIATRSSPCNMKSETRSLVGDANSYAYQSFLLDTLKDVTGQEGTVIANNNVNPNLNYEVPYYSEYRFAPGRKRADFSDEGSFPWMPGHKLKFQTPVWINTHNRMWTNPSYSSYVAAAEDFQVSGFIGAPPFYYELTRPV